MGSEVLARVVVTPTTKLDLDGHVMFGPEVFDELLDAEHRAAMTPWLDALFDGITREMIVECHQRARSDITSVRGFLALGADDPSDRIEALDLLGIDRQLVLPPVAWPTLDAAGPEAAASRRRYNSWMAAWAADSKRLVPAGQLALHSHDDALADADELIGAGFRAVEVPFAHPPGGVSPGDRSWDRLWARLAEAGVAVVLHLGGAGLGTAVPPARRFLDRGWLAIEHLEIAQLFPDRMRIVAENSAASPMALATLHLPAEVFVSSMVLGGALERHPGLRLVLLEMGGQWVPSWLDRLDGIADAYPQFALPPLRERPSEVVLRQVRVAPFERNDVAGWLDARPDLVGVFAFASDYPHAEGGRDPAGRLAANLSRHGDDVLRRFFVDNAAPILR